MNIIQKYKCGHLIIYLKLLIIFLGVFRPPADGIYLLTFYGLVQGIDGGNVYIKRNDDVLCSGWLRSDQQYDSTSCTAIAQLTTFDSVRVTGSNGDPADLRGNSYSGFAGVLYDLRTIVVE